MAEDVCWELAAPSPRSLDAAALEALRVGWLALRDGRGNDRSAATFRDAAHRLAARVVAHRARLFEAIAALNVADDADTAEGEARYEAHRDAVKLCTGLLGEMSAALGLTSLPAPTRA